MRSFDIYTEYATTTKQYKIKKKLNTNIIYYTYRISHEVCFI